MPQRSKVTKDEWISLSCASSEGIYCFKGRKSRMSACFDSHLKLASLRSEQAGKWRVRAAKSVQIIRSFDGVLPSLQCPVLERQRFILRLQSNLCSSYKTGSERESFRHLRRDKKRFKIYMRAQSALYFILQTSSVCRSQKEASGCTCLGGKTKEPIQALCADCSPLCNAFIHSTPTRPWLSSWFPRATPSTHEPGSNNQGFQIRACRLRHQHHHPLQIVTVTNFYSGGKRLILQLTDCGEDACEAEVIHSIEWEQVIQELFPFFFTAQESVTLVKLPSRNKLRVDLNGRYEKWDSPANTSCWKSIGSICYACVLQMTLGSMLP